jgi:hypothetical protein
LCSADGVSHPLGVGNYYPLIDVRAEHTLPDKLWAEQGTEATLEHPVRLRLTIRLYPIASVARVVRLPEHNLYIFYKTMR